MVQETESTGTGLKFPPVEESDEYMQYIAMHLACMFFLNLLMLLGLSAVVIRKCQSFWVLSS